MLTMAEGLRPLREMCDYAPQGKEQQPVVLSEIQCSGEPGQRTEGDEDCMEGHSQALADGDRRLSMNLSHHVELHDKTLIARGDAK